MVAMQGVVFDFGDTLLHRSAGPELIVAAAERRGVVADRQTASTIWNQIQLRARTPEELAKGRDLSEDAHRWSWLELYRAADDIAPGISKELYAAERDDWSPYEDTVEVLRRLRAAAVRVAVLSDTGFDIRPLFARWNIAGMIDAWILSFEQGVTKPAAELFIAACAAIDTAPASTLMVGDNPLTDGGAVNAGMPTLLLPPWPGVGPRGLGHVLALVGS